jgi:hypothetical protein
MAKVTKPIGKSIEDVEEYGMSSFFSEDVSEATSAPAEGGGNSDPNIYATSLNNEKVQNGIYKSRVRFIKNPNNTKDSVLNVLHKWMYFLPHPDITDGRLVLDCTSNFGIRDNIVSSAFFYLKGTKSPSLMKLGKDHFSRKGYHFSLLKIISDLQQPDLEGQIKVYRFAKQVNEKLDDILKDDPAVGVKGVNFSHPFSGRDFIIDIRLETFKDEKTGQEKELTSYSKSKFVDKASILEIPNYEGNIEASEEYARALFNWTKENSPNLADYQPKKWTEEDEDMAIRSVRMVIDDDNIFNQIYRKQYKKSFVFTDLHGNPISSTTEKSSGGLQISEDSMLENAEAEVSKKPVKLKSVEEDVEKEDPIYSSTDEVPDEDEDEFEH